MTWGKLDDRLHSHPKARRAGLEAMGLWVMGLSFCNAYSTDGHIGRADVEAIAGRRPDALAARLVTAGLWEPTDDGWCYHDFHEYNPSAQEVAAERQRKVEAGRRGGLAKARALAAAAAGAGGSGASSSQAPATGARGSSGLPSATAPSASTCLAPASGLLADARYSRPGPIPIPDPDHTHTSAGARDVQDQPDQQAPIPPPPQTQPSGAAPAPADSRPPWSEPLAPTSAPARVVPPSEPPELVALIQALVDTPAISAVAQRTPQGSVAAIRSFAEGLQGKLAPGGGRIRLEDALVAIQDAGLEVGADPCMTWPLVVRLVRRFVDNARPPLPTQEPSARKRPVVGLQEPAKPGQYHWQMPEPIR